MAVVFGENALLTVAEPFLDSEPFSPTKYLWVGLVLQVKVQSTNSWRARETSSCKDGAAANGEEAV